MDTPKINWGEIVKSPFKSLNWKLFALAFFTLAIIKVFLKEAGLILGAIPATFLLFLLIWLFVMIPFVFRTLWRRASVFGAFYQHQRKGVLIVVGALVLLTGFWYFVQSSSDANEVRWSCLQKIEYAPIGFYYFSTDKSQRFKTQDEAMEYCLLESERFTKATSGLSFASKVRLVAESTPISQDTSVAPAGLGYEPITKDEEMPSDFQITFENKKGLGEALGWTLLQTFGGYILLIIVILGGFRLINPHLERTPFLRSKQVGLIAVLFLVVAVFAELLLRTSGISLF